MNNQSCPVLTFELWSPTRRILFRYVAVFTVLSMLSIPFPYRYLPDPGQLIKPVSEALASWFAITVLNFSSSFESPLLSDTTGLYVHILVLIVLSSLISTLWGLLDRKRPHYIKAAYWLCTIAGYYLALQLFEYGFNKVFKWQFYLPEPNTLFTTVGETPRDLLYWSLMGASRPYTMFVGFVEVLGGCLLLFRRSRTTGALLGLGIMVNVVAVNFAFDISVKVYSLYLLFLCLVVLHPHLGNLLRIFWRDQRTLRATWEPVYRTGKPFQRYVVIKALVIVLMFFDVLVPYVRSGNYNDDTAPRPPLHGAWSVQQFVQDGDTLLPLITTSHRWRRVFIHRRGYFIVQNMDDAMLDYRMQLDTIKGLMYLNDPRNGASFTLRFETDNSGLSRLEGVVHTHHLVLTTQPIDLSTLPLLQNEFHWTID